MAEKPHDAVVKFDTYRNVQRHRAALPAIARHLVYIVALAFNDHILTAMTPITNFRGCLLHRRRRT